MVEYGAIGIVVPPLLALAEAVVITSVGMYSAAVTLLGLWPGTSLTGWCADGIEL